MAKDIIRIMKGFEKDFLRDNFELYTNDRMSFLKKKDDFINKRFEELKKDESEE